MVRRKKIWIAPPSSIVHECSPVPPALATILAKAMGTLKEMEGYIIMDEISVAIFKTNVDTGGGISIPLYMAKAFQQKDAVMVVIVKKNPKPKPKGPK